MARKVYVSSDIGQDEAIIDAWEIDPSAAVLWPWLLPLLDDWGRGSADPRRIKAAMFGMAPIAVDQIEQALEVFDRVGLIQLYEVEGRRYLAVDEDTWFKYQTHIHKSKRDDDSGSKFPPPPRGPAGLRGESRDDAENRASPPPSTLTSPPPSSVAENRDSTEAVDKCPRGVEPEDWKAALRLVDGLIAEGEDIQSRGAYARWFVNERKDRVRAERLRATPSVDLGLQVVKPLDDEKEAS